MSTDVEMGPALPDKGVNENMTSNVHKEPFEGVPLDQITMEYCLQHPDDCKALIAMGHEFDRIGFGSIRVTFLFNHDLILFLPCSGMLWYSFELISKWEWILLGWFIAIGWLCAFLLDIIFLLFHFLMVPFRLLAIPFCREERVIDVLLWSVFILNNRPIMGIRSVRAHLAFYRACGKQMFEDYSSIRVLDRWMPVEMENAIEDLSETVPEAKMLLFTPSKWIVTGTYSVYNVQTHVMNYYTTYEKKVDPWKEERKRCRKERKARRKEQKKQAKMAKKNNSPA